MAPELNIGKILSPIMSTSRVRAMKRQNRDSPKKRFHKHFEDENEKKSDEGSAKDAGLSRPEKEKGYLTSGSEDEKIQEPLHKDLGKQIDIHV